MQSLTNRQKEVLDFIEGWQEECGYPPTVKEIAVRFRIAQNAVRDHLLALERKGHVRRDPGVYRGIRLARRARQGLRLPVLGRVAAGVPLLSEENVEGYITVDPDLLKRRGSFSLRVQGDSMTGAGLLDGDHVIVREQGRANEGEIVVALIDGEATVKRLRSRRKKLWLEPANPAYRPIPLKEDDRILGVVVGLWRKM